MTDRRRRRPKCQRREGTVIWAFSRIRSAPPRHSLDAEKTDVDKGDGEEAAVPLSSASESSAETEPSIDQDDFVEQLAKTLGVQDAVAPLPAEAPVEANCDQCAIERQEQSQTNTSADEGSIPSKKLSDGSVLLSSREDDRENKG